MSLEPVTIEHLKPRHFTGDKSAPPPLERVFDKCFLRFTAFQWENVRGVITPEYHGFTVEWRPRSKRFVPGAAVSSPPSAKRYAFLCKLLVPVGSESGACGYTSAQAALRAELERGTWTQVNARILKAIAAGDV